jgi:hypothetical protein
MTYGSSSPMNPILDLRAYGAVIYAVNLAVHTQA